MILLIRDQLTCPPTWFASYRDLTLFCKIFHKLDIVIESNEPDTYYGWLKPRGGMDFVEEIIRPGSEMGVRLDIWQHYPKTVVTDRIAIENVHKLIAEIRGLAA